MITKETVADFVWSFHDKFFLETQEGNFVWSDRDYGGDNTIWPFKGGIKQWCKTEGIPFGRCKGRHTIKHYCGPDVIILS